MAKKSEIRKIFKKGILTENPILVQVIGICSALAVTNLMMNSLIMGIALTLVTAFSCLTVSILKKYTPKHIRMMVQVLIISSYVIIVDISLKALMPEMSKALGPYVGLIITNCIIMGRAEGFAQSNPPMLSFMDGLASGLGYTAVLMIISFVRESLGFGTVFGMQILPDTITRWTLMVMPPSAFFILAGVMWAANNRRLKLERKGVEKR
ncbi:MULTISPECIES: NADH:ubiquinone reductase (Na(+)-transporting) subunit D [unclassified Sedimentibacter]|uniref:NADH:ubiquinone reductase (Na(+)-transporting) subunit D n=1 Tax=unclassified Sedimentibacter TaxID=2649220 RepID=UPI001BD2F98C|nr:NADH:ubiquinone reductase (Na(+)-transporting) subunit D [Sedimentibacter sp. MB35-C1]WMJ77666.1 NADH:ubiquinone reductase (Na(+)-transporting) subunit D [Sedimentibacter sp. MB35-C1]